jgi:5-hydroxyisourate hydrolase-like protein (transthyretin family)
MWSGAIFGGKTVKRVPVKTIAVWFFVASFVLAGNVTLLSFVPIAQPTTMPTEGFTSPTLSVTPEMIIGVAEEDKVADQESWDINSQGVTHGEVINGTTGEPAPGGLEVKLVGVDEQILTFSETSYTDEKGEFNFKDLEIIPGRVFIILVNYQGVDYFSETTPLTGDETILEMPVVIFEKTKEVSHVRVGQLHIMFEFSTEGIVDVTEVWLMKNVGDRTIVSSEDQEVIWIELPEDFSDLRFYDMFAEDRYRVSDHGFVIRGALRPTDSTEWVFSFILPYGGERDYNQVLTYPVDAVVILITEGGPKVVGDNLEDRGVRNFDGVNWHTYSLGPLAAGETLALKFSDSLLPGGNESTSSNIMIGAIALVCAIVVVGTWLLRSRSRLEKSLGTSPSAREALLQAIALLDDEYEAGEIREDEYRQQREALKREVLALMQGEND